MYRSSLCVGVLSLFVLHDLPAALAKAESLPKDATEWTQHHCVKWASEKDLDDKVQMGIKKHGVNGKILLLVDDSDLRDDFGIESSLQRKIIMNEIDELRNHASEHTLNFWELRSMNRQKVDYVAPLLSMAPRWAITQLDTFPEYCHPEKVLGQDHSSIFAYAEWFVCPEAYIWMNRDTIMCGLPFGVSICVLLHLVFKVVHLGLYIVQDGPKGVLKGLLDILLRATLIEMVCGSLAWAYSGFIWPVLPWFVCDLWFYASVYLTPISRALSGLRNLIGQGTKPKNE